MSDALDERNDMGRYAVSKLRYALLGLISFVCGSYVGYFWRDSIALSSNNVVQFHIDRHAPSVKDQQTFDDVPHYSRSNIAIRRPKSVDKCSQFNIMFLKTHKTASSAIQNVLLRYADKHKLTVGLTNKVKDIRFHYGRKFNASFVARKNAPVNILCHHMVFDYNEVKKVMPENTTYITILREPGALFESIFDYMHYSVRSFARIPKVPLGMEFWLNHTEKLFHGKDDGSFWWFAKNAVFYDLGYNNLREDKEYIQNSINKLDKHFDLVLIADYFEESLLLLKDKLCWSFADIVVLKINARSSPYTVLNKRLVKKIREWNSADAAVYDHFNRTFWKKVKAYGADRMRRDLKTLKKMEEEVRETCIEGKAVSNKFIKDKKYKVYNPKGVVMRGYNIRETAKKNKTCINFLKGEIQWTNELLAQIGMPQIDE